MTKTEKSLTEAIDKFLSGNIGLKPDAKADDDNNPANRGQEYLHGQIDEMFALKSAEFIHHTGICAAFSKTHSYKYLDDPSFIESFEKDMTAQGIPAPERAAAVKLIPEIIKEMRDEQTEWAESDFGFNDNLDDIMDIPQQYEQK